MGRGQRLLSFSGTIARRGLPATSHALQGWLGGRGVQPDAGHAAPRVAGHRQQSRARSEQGGGNVFDACSVSKGAVTTNYSSCHQHPASSYLATTTVLCT